MSLNLSYREGHIVIVYHDDVEFAEVQTYSADGKPHDLANRRIALDKIPLLLFNLIEHDYVVSRGTKNQFGRLHGHIMIASRRELVMKDGAA